MAALHQVPTASAALSWCSSTSGGTPSASYITGGPLPLLLYPRRPSTSHPTAPAALSWCSSTSRGPPSALLHLRRPSPGAHLPLQLSPSFSTPSSASLQPLPPLSRSSLFSPAISGHSEVFFKPSLVFLNYLFCRSQPIIINKRKVFKISSFKGNLRNDEAGTDRGPKLSKKAVQLSSSQQEKAEITAKSPEVAEHSTTFESEDIEASVAGSSAIKKLFAKWLTLLRAPPQGQAMHEPCNEKLGGMGESEILEAEPQMHTTETNNLMKAALLHFWKLDATIKLPLLIFPPSYMAVRVFYGAAATIELMPLWVLGPLVVALYVKMIKGLCFLYALCFKLSSNFVTRLPHYHKFYINEGRIAAYLQVHLWQPIIDIKTANYKELSIQKLEQLREWVIEKQLDYVESIWPYYCRTIRFLKKANLF